MKKLIIVILITLGFIAIWQITRPLRQRAFFRTSVPTLPTQAKEDEKSTINPFGVMLSKGMDLSIAKKFGAAYYRTSVAVFLDQWSGVCNECDEALSQNLQLILTIRNNGGGGKPATPPTDYETFRNSVSQIVSKYKPAVLVIENEENSEALFYTGTPEQYNHELKVACEVAHQSGIKCANGGIVSSLAVLLVANHYLEQGDVSTFTLKKL